MALGAWHTVGVMQIRPFLCGSAVLASLCAIGCQADHMPSQPVPAHNSPGDGGAAGTPSAGGGGDGGGTVEVPPNEASIISWNLETFPLTPDAVSRAAALIAQLDPDIVAIQEIAEPAAFDELVASLEGYDGIINDDPGAFLRLGVVYKRSRVAIDGVETLFDSNWYAFPRPPLKVHATIDAARPIDFTLMVVHLKAMLDAESQDRRTAACLALDEWVRAEIDGGADPDIVILGDYNDKLTDPPEWNVFGPFLDAPKQYSFLTMPLAEAGEHSYIPFESMIDHVLVTGDALDEVGSGATEVLALEQTVEDYRDLSDHRPVRSWLRWR